MCGQKNSIANSCFVVQDYVTKGIILGWMTAFGMNNMEFLLRCSC